MTRLEYAPVNGEDSEELNHKEYSQADIEDTSDGLSCNGKGYEDRPDRDSKFCEQDIESRCRGPEGFSTRDYQRMEFDSPSKSDSCWQPLYRRAQLFANSWFLSKPSCIPVLLVMAVIAILVIVGIIVLTIRSTNSQRSLGAQATILDYCTATSYWKGWQSINYAFALFVIHCLSYTYFPLIYCSGDSWSSTSFDFTLDQPTPAQPLGNPPFPGFTSSNSTNWIGYLTTKYNASLLLTHNLAVSGTTLDNHITNGFPIPVTEQIYQRFMPKYAEAYWTPWKRDGTLFIMFIGINDVEIMTPATGSQLATIYERLEKMHFKLLSSLYGTGARNFLLLTLPPLERVWQPPEIGQDIKNKIGSDTAAYNARVRRVAGKLKTQFPDTNVFVFDVNKLFNRALDDPHQFEQLRGISNTTGFCPSYEL
jgi:lysophospholipase L1-like esterase